jgi:hypothetical protein
MPRDKVVRAHTEERGIFKTTVREYATGEKEVEIANKVTGARFTLTPEEYEEFTRRFERARRQALATGKKLKPRDIDEMLKEVTREREKWGGFELEVEAPAPEEVAPEEAGVAAVEAAARAEAAARKAVVAARAARRAAEEVKEAAEEAREAAAAPAAPPPSPPPAPAVPPIPTAPPAEGGRRREERRGAVSVPGAATAPGTAPGTVPAAVVPATVPGTVPAPAPAPPPGEEARGLTSEDINALLAPLKALRWKEAKKKARQYANKAKKEPLRRIKEGFTALISARYRPTTILYGLAKVVTFASLAIAVGVLGGWIEGQLNTFVQSAPPVLSPLAAIAQLLVWALGGLYQGLYLLALLAAHAMIATVILAATRLGRSRWALVDLVAWTVLSAVYAATAQAVWIPLFLGFAGEALFAVLVALSPAVMVVTLLAVILLVIALLLTGWAAAAGEWGEALGKLLTIALFGPLLPLIGGSIQLYSLGRLTEESWKCSDVAVAVLIALLSIVVRFAQPLAAAAMMGVWIIFGLVASASRDWRWFRIPLAATAAFIIVSQGLDSDLPAYVAIQSFKALGQQLNAPGMVKAATFYEGLLEMTGAKVRPTLMFLGNRSP